MFVLTNTVGDEVSCKGGRGAFKVSLRYSFWGCSLNDSGCPC